MKAFKQATARVSKSTKASTKKPELLDDAMVALWSFKDRVGVGFFAGTLLHPEPPVTTMAGPWNARTNVKARRIDIQGDSDFDEAQLRSWLAQARELTGWAKGCAELS